MKNTLTILLSGLLLCGCSQKQATPAKQEAPSYPALNQIEDGKDAIWGRYVLHVAKRDGASLEGVQISDTLADGQIETITADAGTVQPVVYAWVTNDSAVSVCLRNAKIQIGTKISIHEGYVVSLKK
jgi:uncharacterized lipoprotein YajG